MGEGEVKLEPVSKEKWVPITQLPSLDFYVGAQYLGAFRNRLEVDVNAIEAFCRETDIPPIVLSSDSKYQPPAAIEPEMVAPGLAARKKLSFVGPKKTEEKGTPSLVLVEPTTETIYDHRSRVNLPVGYKVIIRDRKIIHDYQQEHPLADNEEVRRQFVRSFERSIRQGILGVTLFENVLHFRDITSSEMVVPNQAAIDGLIRLLWAQIGQLPSLALGLTPIAYIGRTSSELMKAVVVGLASMSASQVVVEQLRKRIDAVTIARELGAKFHGSYAYNASDEWRQEKFPNRFPKEHMGLPQTVDAVFTLIPMSTILKPLYIASYALSKHPKPLVRLR